MSEMCDLSIICFDFNSLTVEKYAAMCFLHKQLGASIGCFNPNARFITHPHHQMPHSGSDPIWNLKRVHEILYGWMFPGWGTWQFKIQELTFDHSCRIMPDNNYSSMSNKMNMSFSLHVEHDTTRSITECTVYPKDELLEEMLVSADLETRRAGFLAKLTRLNQADFEEFQKYGIG